METITHFNLITKWILDFHDDKDHIRFIRNGYTNNNISRNTIFWLKEKLLMEIGKIFVEKSETVTRIVE